jgi:RecA-family ATPase/5S rRNA maturation endonuclease (ribonuclease M5)
MPDINYQQLAPEIIKRLAINESLLDRELNKSLSNPNELRFGHKGSLSVDLKKAVYQDHETGSGGGMLELIKEQTGDEPLTWLKQNGLIANDAPGNSSKTEYIYHDENGKPAYKVTRKMEGGNKTFSQSRFDQDGREITGRGAMKGVKPLPYRLPQILNSSSPVYIVEGEKDADRLTREGLVATTNTGGSKKFKAELKPYFKGREVVIIQDNDQAGKEHAKMVATSLQEVAKSIKVVDLSNGWPGMPQKADVSDFLTAGYTLDDLNKVVQQTALYGEEEAEKWLSDARLDVDFFTVRPEPRKMLIDGFIPLGITGTIGGRGGVGKSMLALELALSVATGSAFFGHEVPDPGQVVILSAEDDLEEIQRRLYNIRSVMPEAFNADALKNNLLIKSFVGDPLLFTQSIDGGAALATPEVSAIAGHISRLSKPKLIIVDTYSRFNGGKENSNEDAAHFVKACEQLSVKTGATVLIMAHMRKGSRGDADDLAGGARFVDSSRWSATLDAYLVPMGEDKLKKAGMSLAEASRYLSFRIVKDNYVGKLNHVVWLERSAEGVLMESYDMSEEVAAEAKAAVPKHEAEYNRVSSMLVDLLGRQPMSRTKLRDSYAGTGNHFGVGQSVLLQILDNAMKNGLIVSKKMENRKGEVLTPK